MRRAAKVDANQSLIVAALRKAGCSVWSSAALGKGFPDLVVGYQGRTFLVEVKDGSKPPSARQLTPDQQEFVKNWKGDWTLIESVEEVGHFIAQADYDAQEWR